ncbi:hypothetical protein [Lactobacillus delbrueckii]|nr:hypothetical protein [Lactobacillus delbrueckii]MDA3783941.1 hypothetical protein [Lactobacillus delbrueckii]
MPKQTIDSRKSAAKAGISGLDSFSDVFLPDAADNQVDHQAKQG